MSLRKKKSVIEPIKALKGPLKAFREKMISKTVSEDTATVYKAKYEDVMTFREPEDSSYEILLRYIQTSKHGVTTKRQSKSAFLHQLLMQATPMCRAEADDIDFVLDGAELTELEEKGAQDGRLALTIPQVEMCIKEARLRGHQHTGDFMELTFSICSRPMDADVTGERVEGLELGLLNSPQTIVWCHRKAPGLTKKKLGAFEPHYFWRQEGIDICRKRMAICKMGPLFPDADGVRRKAAEVIQFVAEREGWRGLVTGAHNLRHGAATAAWSEAWTEAIRATKERGQWTSKESAVRYGKPNRMQPKKAEKASKKA